MLVTVALMANHGLISFKTFVSRFPNQTVQLVFFCLYLILHACAVKFDVIVWGENFWELNQALSMTGAECRQTHSTTPCIGDRCTILSSR